MNARGVTTKTREGPTTIDVTFVETRLGHLCGGLEDTDDKGLKFEHLLNRTGERWKEQ